MDKGFSTLEALVGFTCLLVFISLVIPLLMQMSATLSDATWASSDAQAHYELNRLLPHPASWENDGVVYTSYWKGELWCVARGLDEISCISK